MTSVNVDFLSLDDLIDKLKQNNQEVYNIIKNTNDAIRTLDETVWNSTEKNKLNESLEPYMKNLESKFPGYLDDCTDILSRASNLYQDVDNKKEKKVEDVVDYIKMDII